MTTKIDMIDEATKKALDVSQFRMRNRIFMTRIPTIVAWQASTSKPRSSERGRTPLEAIKKLADRHKMYMREVL